MFVESISIRTSHGPTQKPKKRGKAEKKERIKIQKEGKRTDREGVKRKKKNKKKEKSVLLLSLKTTNRKPLFFFFAFYKGEETNARAKRWVRGENQKV